MTMINTVMATMVVITFSVGVLSIVLIILAKLIGG